MIQRTTTSLWPSVEDFVPPELPPSVAVARLVALARSLLIENRELREALDLARLRPPAELVEALKPRHDRSGVL